MKYCCLHNPNIQWVSEWVSEWVSKWVFYIVPTSRVMQAGTTTIYKVFGMTWTKHHPGIEPIKLLGQCWVPPIVTFTISRGYWGPIQHQGAPSGASYPDLHFRCVPYAMRTLSQEGDYSSHVSLAIVLTMNQGYEKIGTCQRQPAYCIGYWKHPCLRDTVCPYKQYTTIL